MKVVVKTIVSLWKNHPTLCLAIIILLSNGYLMFSINQTNQEIKELELDLWRIRHQLGDPYKVSPRLSGRSESVIGRLDSIYGMVSDIEAHLR